VANGELMKPPRAPTDDELAPDSLFDQVSGWQSQPPIFEKDHRSVASPREDNAE